MQFLEMQVVEQRKIMTSQMGQFQILVFQKSGKQKLLT